jgi:hypothetical protein
MASRSTELFLAAAMAASVSAWANANAQRVYAVPARPAGPAPHHYDTHVPAPHQPAPQALVHHAHTPPPRFAPPTMMPHAPIRPPVFVRPIVTTYLPLPRPAYPVHDVPRVVSAPGPYFVIVGSAYAGTGNNLAYPAEPDWKWTPVESVAELAGRSDLRYYCPDTREYYPAVRACPSPWLKVVP